MPPLKPTTWLLWFGPFVLLAAGLATWLVVLRGRRASATRANAEPSAAAAARARALLDGQE